jgi:hypothetical protein
MPSLAVVWLWVSATLSPSGRAMRGPISISGAPRFPIGGGRGQGASRMLRASGVGDHDPYGASAGDGVALGLTAYPMGYIVGESQPYPWGLHLR